VAARYLHISPGHAKSLGQHSHQFFISLTVNWRRGDAHAQRPIMFTAQGTARGARHNAH
jgi:hypothetical protein